MSGLVGGAWLGRRPEPRDADLGEFERFLRQKQSGCQRMTMLMDNEAIELMSGGQLWKVSWHAHQACPQGTAHGSVGICQSHSGDVVLVSSDGARWEFPGGRPIDGESWGDTLCREVREEACSGVLEARLLGFCRSWCVDGTESGLVLVRSIWHARVALEAWKPEHEMVLRKLVPVERAIAEVATEFHPVWHRAFHEAGLEPS